jgi:hypothetical protein
VSYFDSGFFELFPRYFFVTPSEKICTVCNFLKGNFGTKKKTKIIHSLELLAIKIFPNRPLAPATEKSYGEVGVFAGNRL